MTFQAWVACLVVTAIGVLFQPSWAEACGCGGMHPSSVAFDGAAIVFVGTVTRLVGSEPRSRANAGPTVAAFDVARVYRGQPVRHLTIVGAGGDCDLAFRVGETWLVYAQAQDGVVKTGKCTRTRLQAEASQDLAYLEGRRLGQRFEMTTDMWGPYQLVLPPGDFQVWVERAGKAVSMTHPVRVKDSVDQRLALVIEYLN